MRLASALSPLVLASSAALVGCPLSSNRVTCLPDKSLGAFLAASLASLASSLA